MKHNLNFTKVWINATSSNVVNGFWKLIIVSGHQENLRRRYKIKYAWNQTIWFKKLECDHYILYDNKTYLINECECLK